MCFACGSNCGGGSSWNGSCISRGFAASCSNGSCGNNIKKSGCGGNRGGRGGGSCGCNNCVTSMDMLKGTVSELACCSSENASINVYNVSAVTIPASGFVTFDHVSAAHQITPPGTFNLDFSQIRIVQAGTYQYDFLVKGISKTSGSPGTHPLVFELYANSTQILGTQFSSQDKDVSETSLNHIVQGFGTISVPGNTILQVHNVTGASSDTVDLVAFPTGGLGSALVVNASLRIFRTC